MKKLLLTSFILTWTLSFGVWNFAESANAAFTDHSEGNPNAPVHMEVFDDYQCPFCQRFHESLQSEEIRELVNTGTLKITPKDFPLSFHAQAMSAAQAANAVGSLAPEKYFLFVNTLFDNQSSWTNTNALEFFKKQAATLGIDEKGFLEAYNSPSNIREIERDQFEGEKKGVNGTPTFFVNGKLYSGAQPLQVVLEAIEDAKNSTPPAGFENEVISQPIEEENPFSDTALDTMVGQAAAFLYKNGIIGGFSDGSFRGDQAVNRAEAAKFLLLAAGKTPENGLSNPFMDVIMSEWYGPFVVKAFQKGIINGYGDNTFRPGNSIQRDEFLAMLARTFDLPKNLPHSFLDSKINSNAWYWEYAGIASKYNLFPGETNLNPAQKMTRAEMAIAIYQFLKNR